MTALPELPPSIESIDATLKHVAVLLQVTADRVERIENRVDQKLHQLNKLEQSVQRTAQWLAREALKIQAARVIGAVAPTPMRFALLLGAAFLGGFAGQVLFALVGHPSALAR